MWSQAQQPATGRAAPQPLPAKVIFRWHKRQRPLSLKLQCHCPAVCWWLLLASAQASSPTDPPQAGGDLFGQSRMKLSLCSAASCPVWQRSVALCGAAPRRAALAREKRGWLEARKLFPPPFQNTLLKQCLPGRRIPAVLVCAQSTGPVSAQAAA